MIEWKMMPGCDADEPYYVQAFIDGKASYLVAQNLPIEDAALISAAPDLLAALEAAIEHGLVPKSSAAEGGAMRYSSQIKCADQIRAAIKKARGEAFPFVPEDDWCGEYVKIVGHVPATTQGEE